MIRSFQARENSSSEENLSFQPELLPEMTVRMIPDSLPLWKHASKEARHSVVVFFLTKEIFLNEHSVVVQSNAY